MYLAGVLVTGQLCTCNRAADITTTTSVVRQSVPGQPPCPFRQQSGGVQ